MTSGRRSRKSARRREADDVVGINRTLVLPICFRQPIVAIVNAF